MYRYDPNPKDWKGDTEYKFDSAKAPYLKELAKDAALKGPRTYTKRASPGKLINTRGKTLTTESTNPVIIRVDVTGSMQDAPREFFDRAPLIYMSLAQHRSDLEIMIGAIGDAYCDNYPFQTSGFVKGLEYEEAVRAIGCEGRGGGQISESYELMGYFDLNHVKTPKATTPFLFIYGDEKFYNTVDPAQAAHYIGNKPEGAISSEQVWKSLLQRYDLYFLQKSYGSGNDPHIDEEVREHWAHAIGRQRILPIPNMERAVDIIMGTIAKKWGEFDDFKKNLSSRQKDPEVRESVYASIRYIPDAGATKSTTIGSRKAKSTRSLSEMYDEAKDRR